MVERAEAMNKQYKIGDEVLVRGIVNSEVRNGGIHVLHDGVDAFYMLDQIHEPQTVVVPKFVAEWIDTLDEHGLFGLNYDVVVQSVWDWVYENYDCNAKKLHLAYLYGYEVEREKLYTVELFNGQPLVEEKNILYFSSDLAASNAHVGKDKLEAAGFGWVFDCKGVKVVEVKND